MAKIPKDPKEIFPEIIADYKNLFGDDLVSIILYGSATGQEYRPGKSDINFMIVLSEEGIENLELAFSGVKKWLKRNVAVPLFLTESYVETSLDAFPIEYLNIQRNYIRVFGKDILKDLEFNPDFLRLQCEREIKGKLILLREKFLQTGGRGKALIEVIEKSLPAFIAIFKALVYLLQGKDLPQEKTRIIRAIAEELDIDAGVFEKLLDIKEEKVKLGESEITNLFKDYLRQVRKLSKLVDALGG